VKTDIQHKPKSYTSYYSMGTGTEITGSFGNYE